jgi:CO/xanthine dehydrogenase Mo-binding subunit
MSDTASSESMIGVSRPLPAWRAGVLGRTRYAADEAIAGLLHARLVLSPYARASIVSVDASAALDVLGVVAVLTAADLDTTKAGDMRMFEPLADGEIFFAGQPYALVVAESAAAAEDAAALVQADLRPLPAVVDPVAGMRLDSPIARPRAEGTGIESLSSMHAAVGGGSGATVEEAARWSANVVGQVRHRQGDVDAALAASDLRRAGTFETGWVYQAYLEPQVATAIPTVSGGLEIRTSTQGTDYVRTQVAKLLDMSAADISVTGTPLGGSFGGKIVIVDPIVAAAARKLGRPVRLALTRSEDMAMTNPVQGGVIEAEIGATSAGRFTALKAKLIFDAGAYSEWTVHSIAAVLLAGPYRWEAFDIEALGVETNHVGTGSYRAPGGPPAAFAIESLVEEIVEDVHADAVDLRLKNLVATGDGMVDGVAWPHIGARGCLDALAAHPLWTGRHDLPEGEGVGVAICVWPGGKSPASAVCRLESDGSLSVITGMVDMAGTTGSMTAIAAEAFGLSLDAVQVQVVPADVAPTTPLTGGSVITYSLGRAVHKAAEEARERFLDWAAERFEIAPSDLEISDGMVAPKGVPSRAVSVAELAAAFEEDGAAHEPIEGHGPVGAPALAPAAGAHLVHVGVDAATGTVRVIAQVVAQDVGRALNPALIRGQMQGAAAQTLGWALTEEVLFSEDGEIRTGSFLDYTVPRASMVPPAECIIVEEPAPDGPYGARGVGEAGITAGAAAVANAVAAATGVRPRRLPMTPDRLWEAIAGKT